MSLRITFRGEVDTYQELKQILREVTPAQIEKLSNQIPPILYQFQTQQQQTQSIVYRTHDEIVKLIKKLNKKIKQLKQQYVLNFQKFKKQQFLRRLSETKQIISEDYFKQFFQIGQAIPNKKVSLTLKKKSGGRYAQRKCCLCINWKKCKLYILNDGLVTYDQSKGKIQQFLHFGKDFTWQTSLKLEQKTVHIYSHHRKMTLSALSYKQFFIFIYCLDKYLKDYQKQQMEYRFNSFAPVRYKNQVQFYIDGADYFQAVAKAIQFSEQQVFICGWWVSPQFSLIRPCEGKNLDYRLDKLLARTAKKGVKIYIIVYYQSRFLTNDSAHTIRALQALHTNIKVLRHPQIVLPTFWSHHQKLVVVDQTLAFMGGLDICYGRYDTREHPIDQSSVLLYPGIQYNNCRKQDFVEVRNFEIENVQRNYPRLPWHDVALMVKGKCVKDLSRHFIEYWNYSSYQTHFADRYVLISQSNKKIQKKKTGIFQNIKQIANQIKQKIGVDERKSMRRSRRNSCNSDKIQQMVMKEESNTPRRFSIPQAISKLFSSKKQKEFEGDYIDKKPAAITNKESPTNQALQLHEQKKQDIINQLNFGYQQNFSAKQQTVGDLIEEQQFQKKQDIKIRRQQLDIQRKMDEIIKIQTQFQQEGLEIAEDIQKDYLHEKHNQIQQAVPPSRTSLQYLTKAGKRLTTKFLNKIRRNQNKQEKAQINKEQPQHQTQKYICQVLRSASTWSLGCKQFEKSICDAYIQLIKKASKFIYIQNQFFISATHDNGVVKNKIMNAIADRIIQAIKNKQNFKVMIIMPLVPGFAGQLDDPSASLPRVIMNWQYRTISRGENSLVDRISKHTSEVGKYLQIYSLRKHGLIQSRPVTQIIYLHSKLMIVDDRSLICGSANINDRSMQGNRDSELCLLVQSKPEKQILIDKQPFKVVQKIHKLRIKLWQQHFGISQFMSRNPVNQKLWSQIQQIAISNSIIYKQLFGCYPDDEMKKVLDIKKFKKQEISLEKYNQMSEKIQGHAVIFPLAFLEDEKLTSYHPDAIST